jgi:N-acetyl-anhydromuramoyl-L-alanine amidase
MKINKKTGMLENVRHLVSPHYNARSDKANVDLLVVHGISLPPEDFSTTYIDKLFTGTLVSKEHPYFQTIDKNVSSHVLIGRDGKIAQYVSFYDRAWHAGKSNFQGRENCNDFSIGVELVGADNIAYELVQYEKLAELAKTLINFFPKLTSQRIAGHCDIASDYKTDPGPAFDWALFRGLCE